MTERKLKIIKIRCKAPIAAEDAEIAEFVTDALETWGGQRRPDDSLFNSLRIEHVVIRDIVYVNEEPKE